MGVQTPISMHFAGIEFAVEYEFPEPRARIEPSWHARGAMGFVKHAPVLSVFLGGCLSGAALLSLWHTPAGFSDARSPHTREVAERRGADQLEQLANEREAELERQVVARVELEPKAERLEEPEDAGRSAADVLAYLEAAYQQRLVGSIQATDPKVDDDTEQPEPDAVLPAAPPDKTSTTDAELSTNTEERNGQVDNDVRVVLNQTDTHETDEHHGDVVAGDKVLGSKVQGDVHVGDVNLGAVNNVQQVALLYYQSVFLLPQASQVPLRERNPQADGRRPVNPFGSVMLSPDHDPWKTSLAEPGSPWSSVGPVRR